MLTITTAILILLTLSYFVLLVLYKKGLEPKTIYSIDYNQNIAKIYWGFTRIKMPENARHIYYCKDTSLADDSTLWIKFTTDRDKALEIYLDFKRDELCTVERIPRYIPEVISTWWDIRKPSDTYKYIYSPSDTGKANGLFISIGNNRRDVYFAYGMLD